MPQDLAEQKKRKTPVRLTSGQENKVGALLYQHLHNTQDGFALYEEGWSDQRIATEVGCDVRTVTYRRERDDSFLRLQPKGRVMDSDNMALRSWMYEITEKHNQVVDLLTKRLAHGNTDMLHMLQTMKIRHLKGKE